MIGFFFIKKADEMFDQITAFSIWNKIAANYQKIRK